MKATDLMLGDMLTLKGSLFPHKVLAIRDVRYCPHNNATITTTYCDNWMSQDEYEPIPLTVEILEKNGFVYEYYYGACYRSRWGDVASKRSITIGWNSRGEIYQYDVYHDWRTAYGNCSIYVHELQHALRLCGLNELADNFKI